MIWGVDPGLHGAVVAIEDKKIKGILRMPKMPHPTSKILKHKIDPGQLIKQMAKLPEPDQAIIELPDPMRSNSRVTLSSLFHSIGIADACVSVYCDEVYFIQPQRWKRKYNLIDQNKSESNKVANQIFDELDIQQVQQADISEAALIAHYLSCYYSE